ncbi:MAG: hypothetical protein WCV99_16880, partial [Sterolibacterium sp.]
MLGYIRSLEQLTIADHTATTPTTATTTTAAKAVKSLDQQIVELMRSLPPAMLDRPWALLDLVNRLEGRYRQRPHSQGVGQA